MNKIEKYYDLKNLIEMSDYVLTLDDKEEKFKEGVEAEREKNRNLKDEFNVLNEELNHEYSRAVDKNIALLQVVDHFINSINNIHKRNYYPDLGQGMIIRGYLLGLFISECRTALFFEGGIPRSPIYMSLRRWSSDDFLNLLISIKHKLENSEFKSLKHSIDFFETEINGKTKKLISELSQKREV